MAFTISGIALGANLGDPVDQLVHAVEALARLPGVEPLALSPLYRTAPWGFVQQPDFYNAVLLLTSAWPPAALLGACLGIEAAYGRKRAFPNGPRTLDLDLLFCGEQTSATPWLTLPHPRMTERAFVMIPLAAVWPHWQHPTLGHTAHEWAAALGCVGVQRLAPLPAWESLRAQWGSRFQGASS